jgi:hypothetical protein
VQLPPALSPTRKYCTVLGPSQVPVGVDRRPCPDDERTTTMPAADPQRRQFVSKIALIHRHRGRDDPDLPGLYRDMRARKLEELAESTLSMQPPLTTAQIERIVALLLRHHPTGEFAVHAESGVKVA